MNVFVTAITLIAIALGLVFLVRTNLENRAAARKLREVFIAQAHDLVAKPEFPDAHAKLLIGMASIPQGWATRYFVTRLAGELLWAGKRTNNGDLPKLEQVPQQLQKKFVLAMLAFTLSDSYRCVIFGRIFRATNSWLHDAVQEPKPDVNAHATRNVIVQVAQMSNRKVDHHPEMAMI